VSVVVERLWPQPPTVGVGGSVTAVAVENCTGSILAGTLTIPLSEFDER